MISIVSAKAQRLLKILNRLPRNYGYLSYESIQSFNSCSINTAYADAKFILEKWEVILELKLVDKGIISLNKSDSDFEFVRRLILKDEFELLLIWTVFNQPNLTTSHYSSILSCSESHFRKSISTINNRFKKYSCYIQYDDKMRTWSFSATTHIMGAQLITRIAEVCNYTIPEINGTTMDPFNYYSSVSSVDTSELITEPFDFFLRVLKYYLHLKHLNIDESLKVIYKDTLKGNISYSDFKKELEHQFSNIISNLNTKVEFKNGVDSMIAYLYYLYLRNNMFAVWIRPETGRHQTALYRLKNERPLFVSKISDFIRIIDTKYKSNLNAFIDEITIWSYININYTRSAKYRKLGIISDLGSDHVNVLTTFLYEHFDAIECINDFNTPLEKIADIDLIISNSKSTVMNKGLSHLPHVILSDIITIDEIASIYSKLYDIQFKRKVYDR